jgi:hypothetical protein
MMEIFSKFVVKNVTTVILLRETGPWLDEITLMMCRLLINASKNHSKCVKSWLFEKERYNRA